MNNKSPKYYLVAAIVWTVIAIFAMALLFMASGGGTFARLCGLLLICLCVTGQWMRYFRSK